MTNKVFEMFNSGSTLGEILAETGTESYKIINYLSAKALICRKKSDYNKLKVEIQGFQKRLYVLGIGYKHSGAGISLGDWCRFYGCSVEEILNQLEAKSGIHYGNFLSDCHEYNLYSQTIQKGINENLHAKYEKNGYPPTFTKKLLFDANYVDGASEIFSGDLKPCKVKLDIIEYSGKMGLYRAYEQLFHDLRGIAAISNGARPLDYYGLIEVGNPGGGNAGINILFNLEVVVNIKILDQIVRKWANMYCFALDVFEYCSQELVTSARLSRDSVIEQSLIAGE